MNPGYGDTYRGDVTCFERLYGETLIDLSPEEGADGTTHDIAHRLA